MIAMVTDAKILNNSKRISIGSLFAYYSWVEPTGGGVQPCSLQFIVYEHNVLRKPVRDRSYISRRKV